MTPTAPTLLQKMGRTFDLRMYSRVTRSSASGLIPTSCSTNSVTASVSAAIAACEPSSMPSSDRASLAGGSHSIGGAASNARTPSTEATTSNLVLSEPDFVRRDILRVYARASDAIVFGPPRRGEARCRLGRPGKRRRRSVSAECE